MPSLKRPSTRARNSGPKKARRRLAVERRPRPEASAASDEAHEIPTERETGHRAAAGDEEDVGDREEEEEEEDVDSGSDMEELMTQFLQEKTRKQTGRAKTQIRSAMTAVQRRAKDAQAKLQAFREEHCDPQEDGCPREEDHGESESAAGESVALKAAKEALSKVHTLDKRMQEIVDGMAVLMKEAKILQTRIDDAVAGEGADGVNGEVSASHVLQLADKVFAPGPWCSISSTAAALSSA